MASVADEIKAFDQMRARLEAEHNGKWVLFHDLKLIGLFDSFEQAATEAVKRFGRGPYLIRQIGEPPMMLPISVVYHRHNGAR